MAATPRRSTRLPQRADPAGGGNASLDLDGIGAAPGRDDGTGADAPLPAEFALIGRHFRPIAGPGSLGLGDDGAVLTPPPGRQLVLSADALVAGVHFLPDDPPDLIARKLLRVNFSDLAAMGALPLGHLVTLAAPKDTPDAWFADFARGLAKDGAQFGSSLLGGDTTSTSGPVVLSATVLGHAGPGRALRRSGARPGDGIWVTGTIGDAALGLLAARGSVADPDGFLLGRYQLPTPRIGLDTAAAAAGMDVSDGLVQDVGHLCRAATAAAASDGDGGAVAAELEAGLVPLSAAARAAVEADSALLERCLTGGDDYELVLAVHPRHEAALLDAAGRSRVPLTRIGRFVAGPPGGVRVLDAAGQALPLVRGGWNHF